jgi:hypothetical protein
MSTFLTSVGGPDTLDYFVTFLFLLACHDKGAQPPQCARNVIVSGAGGLTGTLRLVSSVDQLQISAAMLTICASLRSWSSSDSLSVV